MPSANINGINIHYEVYGVGEPLVLITGYGVDCSVWQSILDPLSKIFQVIIFDNRGAGRTDAPKECYSIETMANDTFALMNFLNIQQAHVLGHSLGGTIAQMLAYLYPHKVKKLIISNSITKLDAKVALITQTTLALRKAGVDPKLLHSLVLPWQFSNATLANSQFVETLIHYSLNTPFPQSLDGQEGQIAAMLSFDSSAWLKTIPCPTLIIAGDEDILTPPKQAEFIAANIPNSKLVTLASAHVPFAEMPKEYVRVVLDFLR
jgi:pimeloyl-ACP methyl ester carboxylesterase